MLDQRKNWSKMAVEDLFLAVSGRFSGFKPNFQRLFRKNAGFPQKSAISKKSFALRNFFNNAECCIMRKKESQEKFGRFIAKVMRKVNLN